MNAGGLGPFGTLLNELLSDGALLKAFLDDPDATLAKRNLTDAQRQALLHARSALDIETEFRKENSGSEVTAETGYVRVESASSFVRVAPTGALEPQIEPEASASVLVTGFVRAADIVDRLDDAAERAEE